MKNYKVAVIAGDIGDNIDPLYDMGVSFVLSTNRVAKPFSETDKIISMKQGVNFNGTGSQKL